ncbi:hypothetical protein B0O80DRAFT_422592 [Mortierella sp. GBAus27b]|nr:hypothetical protein B0O80DRAFT_422592 [Mortierella sp. GBAus27b]
MKMELQGRERFCNHRKFWCHGKRGFSTGNVRVQVFTYPPFGQTWMTFRDVSHMLTITIGRPAAATPYQGVIRRSASRHGSPPLSSAVSSSSTPSTLLYSRHWRGGFTGVSSSTGLPRRNGELGRDLAFCIGSNPGMQGQSGLFLVPKRNSRPFTATATATIAIPTFKNAVHEDQTKDNQRI